MTLGSDDISRFVEKLKAEADPEAVIRDVCEVMTLNVVLFINEHAKALAEAMANVPAGDSALRSRLASEIKALKRICVLIAEAE